jgi:large subunit ribosomal protein L18
MKKWKKITHRTRRRSLRVRSKVKGGSDRPRLSVFRSNRYIYAQIIDDESGRTLATSSSFLLAKAGELTAKCPGNRDAAKQVGMDIASRAKSNGVTRVCFDRGPYKYHGRVQALAEGAREGGLEF